MYHPADRRFRFLKKLSSCFVEVRVVDHPFIIGLPAVKINGFIGSLGEESGQSYVGIFNPRFFKAQSCVPLWMHGSH